MSLVNHAFALAQARHPKATSAVIHKAIGALSKRSHSAKKPAETRGQAAANKTAGVAPVPSRLERTDGVMAANVAAGIPGFESLRYVS